MARLLNLLSTRPPPLFGLCSNPPSKKYTVGAQIPHLTVRSASDSQRSWHVRRLLLMSVYLFLDDLAEL